MSEEMKRNKREISPEIDYIKKKFDKHFLNKFKYIKEWEELPKTFRSFFGSGRNDKEDDKEAFQKYQKFGEFFLIDSEGKTYLAHLNATGLNLVDEGDNGILPAKLERELRMNLLGVTLSEVLEIVKKKREDEENKREKKIVTMSESELVALIKKIV